MTDVRRTRRASACLAAVIVLGTIAAISIGAAKAHQDDAPPAPRLRFISANNKNAPTMYFVQDARSGGCWIANVDGDPHQTVKQITAIAVAPPESCK